MQTLVCQRNEVSTHSKTHSKNGLKNLLESRHENPRNRSRSRCSLISSDAILIVTLKDQIEIWARIIRDISDQRLFLYTDTLAKRRKTGAHNLAQYDVVITTFDVRNLDLTFRSVLFVCLSEIHFIFLIILNTSYMTVILTVQSKLKLLMNLQYMISSYNNKSRTT